MSVNNWLSTWQCQTILGADLLSLSALTWFKKEKTARPTNRSSYSLPRNHHKWAVYCVCVFIEHCKCCCYSRVSCVGPLAQLTSPCFSSRVSFNTCSCWAVTAIHTLICILSVTLTTNFESKSLALLSKFPSVTEDTNSHLNAKHNVRNSIETKRRLIKCRPRRLNAENLRLQRVNFKKWFKRGQVGNHRATGLRLFKCYLSQTRLGDFVMTTGYSIQIQHLTITLCITWKISQLAYPVIKSSAKAILKKLFIEFP